MKKLLSFRLLMEYHSLLSNMFGKLSEIFITLVSVSLRSYIHSYAIDKKFITHEWLMFPSPYGVIFILIS